MANFSRCVSLVLQHEGGLVDNPKDPGGLTNFGISLSAYPSLGAQGIRSMTAEDASVIYQRDYWTPCHCEAIPGPLAMCLLDAAVNCGRDAAAKMLQGAVGATRDGIIGPKTLGAAHTAMAHDARATLTGFNTNRIAYYTALDGFGTFGQGWTRRADNTMYNALAWSTE